MSVRAMATDGKKESDYSNEVGRCKPDPGFESAPLLSKQNVKSN